jgi:5'-methylthioadenosine phosphorylase
MVTDYDCWNEDHDHVTTEMILRCLHQNAATAKQIVTAAIPLIPAAADWPAHSALRHAIMTERRLWPKQTLADLKPILAKYA